MAHRTRGTGPARSMGLVSAALGLPALVAPRAVASAIGVTPSPFAVTAIRAVGLQELAVAGNLLGRERPVITQWSRVAGDVVHVGLLATALRRGDGDRSRMRAAAGVLLAISAADVVAGAVLHRSTDRDGGPGIAVSRAVTIRKSPKKVYKRWRDLERLPEFMAHLRSVEDLGDGRSRWVAEGPAGTTVEWDAEITEDVPGEVIAWRSVEGATVPNEGRVTVRHAPGDQGTEVHVSLRYDPPGGPVGAGLAALFGEDPSMQLADDLRRFKQIIEVGEVVRSDGSPEGSRTGRLVHQRPAQPMEDPSSVIDPAHVEVTR